MRLLLATEHDKTTTSGNEFQALMSRFEMKLPSRTDTKKVRDLYSLAQCPRVMLTVRRVNRSAFNRIYVFR